MMVYQIRVVTRAVLRFHEHIHNRIFMIEVNPSTAVGIKNRLQQLFDREIIIGYAVTHPTGNIEDLAGLFTLIEELEK